MPTFKSAFRPGVFTRLRCKHLTLVILGICFGLSTHAFASCPAGADPTRWINGGKYCLAIRQAGQTEVGKARKMVILVHGDVSKGDPADYMYIPADSFGNDETIAVALIRPGYEDSKRHKSQGSNNNYRDNYTATNIDAMADAIRLLKKRYGVRRTIVMGHSGGAAITGVMLGKHPGIADGAVLVSCPCNIPEWRKLRRKQGKNLWQHSLSPHTFVDRVPVTSRVIAITGDSDDNTLRSFGASYVETLQKRGVNATFLNVKGGRHSFKSLWPAVKDATTKLLAN